MFCGISNFKDIVRVEYYTPGVIFFQHPFSIYRPVVTKGIEDVDKKEFYIGSSNPFLTAAIYEMTGELAVEEQRSVAGNKFKCTLSYVLDWGSTSNSREHFMAELTNLQRSNYDIVLTYLTGEQQVIRSDKDGWAFSCKESGGDVSVSVIVENISGAQRIV